jgi:hypothetical protein
MKFWMDEGWSAVKSHKRVDVDRVASRAGALIAGREALIVGFLGRRQLALVGRRQCQTYFSRGLQVW